MCSGSTEDFGSFSPGSNPGSAARIGKGSPMDKVWTDEELRRAFRMPRARTITFRTSTITNAFVSALLPFTQPKPSEMGEVLNILEMNPNDLRCAYCGDKATEWEHLHPIVKERFPTGYPSSIRNLVPSCGKCNQSKGGKEWRDWIISNAPRSPKSRKTTDLDKRISRLERYEKWANCRRMALVKTVGKDAYKEYFGKLDYIISQMKEAQKMADILKSKISKSRVG